MPEKLLLEDERPLYRQLEAILEGKIAAMEYLPGNAIPSERKLCGLYDVSYITVRRAVAELVKKGILLRRQGKGTFVAAAAMGQTRNIGVVLSSTLTAAHPHVAQIIHGAGAACDAAGFGMQIYPTYDEAISAERNAVLHHLVRTGRVRGLLAVSPMPAEDVDALVAGEVPMVAFVDYKEYDNQCVVMDWNESARKLVGMLLGLGHRRIGIVVKTRERGESPHYMIGDEIVEGAKAALADAGVAFDRSLVAEIPPEEQEWAERTGEMSGLLERPDRPTAVIGAANPLIGGSIRAAERRGMRIPEDISVTGIADVGFDPYYTIAAVDTGAMGRVAAERLIAMIEGKKLTGTKLVLEAPVREGQSVAPPGAAETTGGESR